MWSLLSFLHGHINVFHQILAASVSPLCLQIHFLSSSFFSLLLIPQDVHIGTLDDVSYVSETLFI